MSTLQVHITAGPQAGTRLQLNQSPVVFGRSPDCTLVLDVPVVSRQHGELHLEDGRWVLVNLSQNGTRVGRKKVTKKPCPLADGVAVTIGDTEVFRIHLVADEQDVPAAPEQDVEQTPDRAPGAGLKGRSKLWIGLGIWFAFCIGLMIFFATLDDGDDNANTDPNAGLFIPGQNADGPPGPAKGIAEVRELLREPLPSQDPSEVSYASNLDRASDAAKRGKRGLYEAYVGYQRAISFAQDRNNPLDPQNALTFDRVLDDLAEVVYNDYMTAYRLHQSGRHADASKLLDDLRRNYYRGDHRVGDTLSGYIKTLRDRAHRATGQ